MGVDAYVEEQLHPETIDDTSLEQRLATQYPSLGKSAGEMIQDYPQPRKQVLPAKSKAERLDQLLDGLGLKAAAPGPAQVINELTQATVLRALFSRRQLQETLVDFWSTHFSIYVNKNEDRWLKTIDDRDVIRKHAFGKFGDLLLASASSPAMLEYLDNRLNFKGVPNENYAREIMELHTLGVDGGYTQKDVQELARCLTGWTIRPPRRLQAAQVDYTDAGTFLFDPARHDDDPKLVLGVHLPAGGGQGDGLRMIDVLAHHPSTAHFIAKKLATRYIADTPPEALVQRAALTFTQTDGDIRAVLGTLLHSDEFKNSFASKIKRPFEFVSSAARALDMQLDDAVSMAMALRLMGQGIFQHLTPDGYPDSGTAWINTGGLLARWNFSLLSAANRVPKGHVDLAASFDTPGDAADYWIDRILHRPMPDADRQKLIKAVSTGGSRFDPARVSELVALILASPHFQYR
jgi:uncharacterized protein (DUF1800 family)